MGVTIDAGKIKNSTPYQRQTLSDFNKSCTYNTPKRQLLPQDVEDFNHFSFSVERIDKSFTCDKKPIRQHLPQDFEDLNHFSFSVEKIDQWEVNSNTDFYDIDSTEGNSQISLSEGTGRYSSTYARHSTPKSVKNNHAAAVGSSTSKNVLPRIEIVVGKNEESKDIMELSLNESVSNEKKKTHQRKESKNNNTDIKTYLNNPRIQYLNSQRNTSSKIQRKTTLKPCTSKSWNNRKKQSLERKEYSSDSSQGDKYLNIQRNLYLNNKPRNHITQTCDENTIAKVNVNHKEERDENSHQCSANSQKDQYLNNQRKTYLNNQRNQEDIQRNYENDDTKNDKNQSKLQEGSIHQNSEKMDSSTLSYSTPISSETENNQTSDSIGSEDQKFKFFFQRILHMFVFKY